jgi:hypothetical protein
MKQAAKAPRYPLVSALLLGGVGFICGYFGPIYLNPSSNLGPITGIFFTGPGGCVLGLILGLFASRARIGPVGFGVLLLLAAIGVAGGSLYLSLPGANDIGFIIDAEIKDCKPPAEYRAEVLDRIRRMEEGGWRPLRPGWAEDFDRLAAKDPGVVLTLLVHRKRRVYEQGNPWNKGELRASAWDSPKAPERYYARYAGPGCSAYPLGTRRFFAPDWEASHVSPPDILPSYMGFYVLEDVPEKFRRFVGVDQGT